MFDLGSREVTAEAIIAFGLAYDPLPFHVDPDAPAGGPYGGLVASGRHSALIWMRLYVDAVLSRAAGMGSPGLEVVNQHGEVATSVRGRNFFARGAS